MTTAFDTAGRVTSTTDPLGRTTTHAFDSFGRRASSTDPAGATTSFAYDTLGRIAATTGPRGGVTSTTYTAAGRTASVADPVGNITSYSYDAAGRLASVTDPMGGATSYAYDLDSRVVAITSPAGDVEVFSYDDADRVTDQTDAAGVSTVFSYDARGNLVSTQLSADGPVGFVSDDRDTLAAIDPLGNQTTFGYDARGNQTSVADASGGSIQSTYGLDDALSSMTDQLGRTTSTTYDADGRVDTVADASSRSVTNSYDSAGQLVAQTFAGASAISYTYDDAGRRTSMTDANGTTTFTYDASGNVVSVTGPLGDVLAYTYDLAGRRSSMTHPDGTSASYVYDANSRLTSLAHSTAGATSYTYDADGRLLSESLPDGTTRTYAYTDGRLTSYTENGSTSTVSYDASGRIATVSGDEDWTFSYDGAGQLVSGSRDGTGFAYSYDSPGNLASRDDGSGIVAFSFDAANQLVSDSDGATYSYDEAGRLASVSRLDGSTVTYAYDQLGQLSSEEQSIPVVVSIAAVWADNDDSDDAIDLSGSDSGFAGLVHSNSGIKVGGSDISVAGATEYVSDFDGGGSSNDFDPSPVAVSESAFPLDLDVSDYQPGGSAALAAGGAYVDHSDTCDDEGKLEASAGELAGGLHWVPCDVVISDGGSGSNVTVVSSGKIEVSDSGVEFGSPFVDGLSLFSTVNGSDAVKVGGSDSAFDGAIVAPYGKVEVSGSNNTFNCGVIADTVKLSGSELVVSGCELTTGDFDVTTTTRTYDPDGLLNRVDIVSPGGSVDVYELLWDRTLAVPQVVAMSVNGDTTSFTYGVRRAQAIDSGGAATSFGYSVLGDTTAGSHAVAGGFDPYGTPDTTNVAVGFGYRGELHVGDQVYLRNRDHAPTLGRFLTPDPLSGVAGTTTVVNGYAYAANDPIRNVDPLGLRPSDHGIDNIPSSIAVQKTLPLAVNFLDRFERLGRLEVAAFIPEKRSTTLFGLVGLYLGDNRGFSTNGSIPADQSRFFASIDFATSEVFAQVNPTCSVNGECWTPWPVIAGYLAPWESIGIVGFQYFNEFAFFDSLVDDAFSLRWSVAHSDRRIFSGAIPTEFVRPSFDGELSVRWLSEETLEVRYDGDCFPNVEAHLVLDGGREIRVMEFANKGALFGAPPAGDCHVSVTGDVP